MPIKLAEIKKENDEKEKKDIEQKYNVVGGLKLAKSSTNSKSENKPWYKNVVKGSNLFDDGYDFGDITRTTLNTATNVGANLLKGVSNIGDAVAKTIVGGIATGADILGYDNYADKLKNRLAGKDEVVNERLKNYTPSGLLQKASDATKSNSVVGDTTRDVAQGVGYYAGMLAGQSVGIPWQVTSGVTSVGSELPEAYAEGATNAQAWLSAGISAGAEIGSEYIFGGIKLPGTGKTTETILNKTTNKIKNKALKYITQAGINILGEGAEEVISGIGSALGKQLTYMSDKELNEIYSNEDKLQDFIMGTLVSAVTVGANPTTYQNIKTGRSLINGLTVDEEENLANTNNNKNNINNNQNSSLNNQLNQNEENYQKSSISSINNLVQTNNENLFNYNETNNQKINNLYQSAKESRLNNSQETQQLIDTISKVIEDKNYNILLDNTITNDNGNSVNAKITTNVNNEVEIRINPNSDRAGEFLLVHEISHAIKTPEMIQLVNDFASRNEGFAKAVKEIETTYGKNLTSEEVFADVCGQLFGNQEFINTLETQNTEQSKSLIRQIYEAIKKLLNRLTSEGRYRNFVQDLEVRWRNAYNSTTVKQSINNLNGQTNYMMTGINGMNNSVKVDNKYLDIKDRFIVANDMYNNSYSNEEIRQQTGWFKNAEGNWEFEISDYNTKFKILPKENGKYTLSELFEAKTLYDMYPELKDVSVEFKKIKSNGNFNSEKKKITIKNALLNNLDNAKGTLLHEIQHYIQEYEGLPSGTTILFGNEQYANSLGEIEASDTKNRRNLDVSERKKIVPESAKETPTHPSRNNILNRKRNLVEKTVEKIYNKFGGTQNEVSEEIDIQDNKSTDEKINRTYSKDKNGIRELDNSSFSIEQDIDKYLMPEIYDRYKNEDKTKITETIEELKAYKETLNPNENDEDWNKNFLANQKIKALENGFDNVYDNLINQDRERLLKDYKSAPENIEKQINKIKSKETKAQELKKDYKNATSKQQAQFDIIQKTNPAPEESNYVWIRKPSDIKTFEEIINDEESFTWGDYSKEDALRDLKKGTVTVYSSYAIKNGTFVSTSYQQALDYAGGEPTKVHHRTVSLDSVAWINGDEGQYAKIPTKYSQNNSLWQAHLEKNYKSNGTRTYFDDIKLKGNEMLKSNARYSEIIKNESDNKKAKKILNPNEIANLSENDALTTPKLQEKAYETGDGESRYWTNIKDKTNMLNDTQKEHILSNDEIKYYKKITNEESLNEAFEKLNKGGASETLRWAKMESKDATATDVAEGWILLKRYSDSGDYNSMVEVAKKMRDIGTQAGQTVQAFNIMARMSPEGMVKYAQSELSDAYEKMVKGKTKEWIDKYKNDFDLKPNEVQFIMDTMQEVKDMPDGYDKKAKLAEIQKMMTDKLPPDKDGRIKSWMRISMLFNPKTQVRNVAGNAIIAPVNYIGDIFASRMDKKIAKKTGVRTTGNMNIKAILEGMKKGAYQATNDYKKGINTKDMDGNRFEISNRKSFSDKNLVGKSLNRTEALLNYVMDAGDRVFSEASFENSLQNQMILNNTTEVTQEMIDIAHEEALSRTWNDNNKYTKFVLSVRSGLNNIKLGGYGLGDVLIPFAKTPANLTKAIVDYSPVGLVNSLTKYKAMNNAIETGQFTAKMQHDFVQTLGKATAGTMLYVLGMALAKAGITSGESDDDKDTRDFIKNTLGINSYSIKIGNKSFTYDWAQPLAAPLSIMANIETSKKNKEQALLEGVVNSLDTAGSILLEQSFLSSINDVLSDNAGVVSGIINEVLELPSRAIPTFSKQIVDLTDTTQRQTYEYDKPLQTATNKIKAKLPGLSKTLSPSVDTMGREILRYGGKNNIFNVFLNPANVNTENISESASEIYRVYKVTGDQTIMPRVTPYYINQNGEKTILSTKERTEYAKVSGKIIEDNIKLLLKNSNYAKLEDEEKSQIIKNIVDYSYNKAREDVVGIEMSNTYNGVKTYTMAKGQISDYYLAKKAVSDVKDKYKGDSTAMKNARKQAIFSYVNKLDISKAEKAILFGVTTNYSIKNYRAYLFNYINKLDITKKEKEEIWNKLYD